MTNENTNSRSDKLERRDRIAKKEGKCSYCRPHRGENKVWKKYKTKPKEKDYRNNILVHSDGGKCHGTPLLKSGKCPICGIHPDMQSTEFWAQEQIDIEKKYRK